MITYTNTKNELLYDFTMVAELLRVNSSYLKRAVKKYSFKENDCIKYKNRYLYTQSAIVDLVVFLVTNRLITDVRRLEASVNKNEIKTWVLTGLK